MAFDADRVGTVRFDPSGTLAGVHAAERAPGAGSRRPEPAPVSRPWRARSIEYTFVANQVDASRPFYSSVWKFLRRSIRRPLSS